MFCQIQASLIIILYSSIIFVSCDSQTKDKGHKLWYNMHTALVFPYLKSGFMKSFWSPASQVSLSAL